MRERNELDNRIYHGDTSHSKLHPLPTERCEKLWCGICKDWFWAARPCPNMHEMRNTPVRDLSPEACRALLVHHHGGTLTTERRQAYLFKHTDHPAAYFTPEEIEQVKASISAGI